MRPTSRSPRRRIRPALARTAAAALTCLATLAAGLVLAAPGRRRQPGDAGQLHRLRLRPVHGADPAGDGRLADAARRTGRSASTSPATRAAASASRT